MKIRVGVVGLGRAGRGSHIIECCGYPEDFELAAVCDNDAERLAMDLPDKVPAEIRPKVRRYAALEVLLADPDIDLVSIATRHPDPVPMAIKALEAGKHVFIEKPCAVSLAEMQALKKVADAHPGRLFLRHNRRNEPAFLKIRRVLATGVIGRPTMYKLYRSVGYQRRNDWMTMKQFAGGLLTNWGPHIIDHALQLLASPVAEVWADLKSVICAGDADDQVKLLIRAESGAVADVEIHGTTTLHQYDYEIWGPRGTLVFPENGRIKVRHVDPEIKFDPIQPHPGQPPYKYGNLDETLSFVEEFIDVPDVPLGIIWKQMADAIRGKAPYPITIEEGLEVVRVCDLAARQCPVTRWQ